MKSLSKTAEKIFRNAIAQIPAGQDHIRIDNSNGAYMYLAVEKIGTMCLAVEKIGTLGVSRVQCQLYSFAHYYEQNGDLMRDPEVVMVDINGYLYPASYRQDSLGIDRDYLIYDEQGKLKVYRPKAQADLASFCTDWARNLHHQQGL